MTEKEKLHEIHYVLSNFSHLLNENERIALGAFAFIAAKDGHTSNEFVLKGGAEPNAESRQLLSDGMQPLRKKLADRLLNEYKALIYENSCKQCGRLPATPRAKQCLGCGYSWHAG
ncbi:hypothetical protein [Parachitinimonas caeni]|uniref:Uncharacterized protein n=1 Tax=Parachitinimonas caeni TaxID=3031301 RepID=A0ABT7DYV6_9NEIS|nr:hypothetical protein [Parachitinimonas caeni]MDK2125240.1 hypothetical protein [Parachitinimonas caeni]